MGRSSRRKRRRQVPGQAAPASSSTKERSKKGKGKGRDVPIMIAPDAPNTEGESNEGCTLKVMPIPEGSLPEAVALHFEDFGKILKVQIFDKSPSNQFAFAHVTFAEKSAADKAQGALGKQYLFPEIRGRRTRVTKVLEEGDGEDGEDSDDEIIRAVQEEEDKKSPGAKDKATKGGRRVDGEKKRRSRQKNKNQESNPFDAPAGTSSSGTSNLSDTQALDGAQIIELKDPKQTSRLLYPNPVCLLTVAPPGGTPNVMTISWLTPANNFGTFIMCINKRRHTASLLRGRDDAAFVLSVPTHKLADLVLKIGKLTGAKGDKIKGLSIATCAPGWPQERASQENERHASRGGHTAKGRKTKKKIRVNRSFGGGSAPGGNPFAALANLDNCGIADSVVDETANEDKNSNKGKSEELKNSEQERFKRVVESLGQPNYELLAIKECVAHLKCHVEKMIENLIDDHHYLVKAQIDAAYVRSSHWCGKNFRPRIEGCGDILTFLGSQKFGCLGTPVPSKHESGQEKDSQRST